MTRTRAQGHVGAHALQRGALALYSICAAALLLGSTAASATVRDKEVEPAFEREWLGFATGAIAASNLLFVLAHDTNGVLAVAGIASGGALVITDDGELSSALGAAGILLGVMQIYTSARRPTPTAPRLELIGVHMIHHGRMSPGMLLRYRF